MTSWEEIASMHARKIQKIANDLEKKSGEIKSPRRAAVMYEHYVKIFEKQLLKAMNDMANRADGVY